MLMIIDQIEFFSKQIDVIEQNIEKEINFIDTPLMTIPGISFTISSTILGEINSINRFKDSSKLLAFCGLNPTIHQSGQYLSSHSSMSKRGSLAIFAMPSFKLLPLFGLMILVLMPTITRKNDRVNIAMLF